MTRRLLTSLTTLVALAAAFVATLPTADATPESDTHPAGQPAAEAARRRTPEDRYAMAGGCYAVRSLTAGAYVTRTPDGFAAREPRRSRAEAFHFQATALGRYLLFSSERGFLAADDGLSAGLPGELGRLAATDGVIEASEPSDAADWTIAAAGDDPEAVRPDAFTITLPSREQALAATPDGRLVLVDARSAGDRGRFTFTRTRDCAPWPEVDVNVAGRPAKGASPWSEVRGLLEGHMHGMAFEFLGGRARCGQPWHPYGVTHALVDCPDHEPGGAGAVLENVVSHGSPVGTHDTVGWPTFRDWPAHDSLTHEGAYYKWLERAWRGGLRIFVNLLVDNTALCQLYPYKKNSCNEMDGVRLQARRLHELQDYIDAQTGGPGEGWFRIVTDPFEARKVVNAGKLAVVMGIEVSVLFDCGEYLDLPQCTEDEIDERLDEVYDMGVRQMEIVNKFDNALTGVAGDAGTTGVIVNTGNRHVTGHWWDMQTCDEPHDHTLHAHDKQQLNLTDDAFSQFPEQGAGERDVLAGGIFGLFGATRGFVAPAYPEGPHCNTRGLTELGEHLVRRIIDKGIIFDPDHMSAAGRRQALDILEEEGYSGVISSHGWSSDDAIPRIYALGGLVTPYAGGSAGFVHEWEWTKQFVDGAPDGYFFGFGYGADMNGFGTQGGPRRPNETDDVDYPFRGPLGDVVIDQQVSGERVYDINVDGVAHYGLYPDWIEDLRMVAAESGDELIDDMLRGPEAYLQMWERADGVAPNDCVTPHDDWNVDDLHGLVGSSPEELLRVLGQPAHRDPEHFEYCVTGEDGEPLTIAVAWEE